MLSKILLNQLLKKSFILKTSCGRLYNIPIFQRKEKFREVKSHAQTHIVCMWWNWEQIRTGCFRTLRNLESQNHPTALSEPANPIPS